MRRIPELLAGFNRVDLLSYSTPLEKLDRLSGYLDIDLWIKRDDLTGLSFGGNKTRQLEFYIGEACAQNADTILITGAVQSNFVRSAAAAAAKFGMSAIVQREDRVPDMSAAYHSSGNVLLGDLLDVETLFYPEGEDEEGADRALATKAEELIADGRKPYIIPLGANHPPQGALGYVAAAEELAQQSDHADVIICPSGSGATHGGLLSGLRLAGFESQVFGICVRRDAKQQSRRIQQLSSHLAQLLSIDPVVHEEDIRVDDSALAPGYGKVGQSTLEAMKLMAQKEGIFLDPVYSAKTFDGLLSLLESGSIQRGQKVVLLHTGGQAAIFSYQRELTAQ